MQKLFETRPCGPNNTRTRSTKLFHVVNLAMNLTSGTELAWQERKAASFTISPLHCGTAVAGYRETNQYGGRDGVTLGTATALSGAAISSSMGSASSATTAFLLTLFNARLGAWLGNPGTASRRSYRDAHPRFWSSPLVAEAFGLTNAESDYVYLTDGGHFENLGLYEMVRRRCRWIVVSDGSTDPNYQFGSLGEAIRKIRVDFGVSIIFPEGALAQVGRGRTAYCAVGDIKYSEADGGSECRDGTLILIKAATTGNEPGDVLHYGKTKRQFPQDGVADQFFCESQFESYRMLGLHAVQTICSNQTATTFDELASAAANHVTTAGTRGRRLATGTPL